MYVLKLNPEQLYIPSSNLGDNDEWNEYAVAISPKDTNDGDWSPLIKSIQTYLLQKPCDPLSTGGLDYCEPHVFPLHGTDAEPALREPSSLNEVVSVHLVYIWLNLLVPIIS